MVFRPEVNPYVGLIKTRPDRILLGSKRMGLIEESRALLTEKMGVFAHIALELGSGSGGHLVAQAQRAPDTLFIGSELRFKRVYKTAEKSDELGIPNLLVCHVDARPFLGQFADGSCDTVFVLFPDPWDKKRWRKNRIMSGKTLSEIIRVLKPGGILEYKTDHHEYFTSASSEIAEIACLEVLQTSRDYHKEMDLSANIESEFEKLFKSQNLPLCMLRARKCVASHS